MEWSVYLELKGSSCLLLNFLVFFILSSTTESFPCTLSTGHGTNELAPTSTKHIAAVEVNKELVNLFLWVALTNWNIVVLRFACEKGNS